MVESGFGTDEVAPPQAAGRRHGQDRHRHGLGGSFGSREPGGGDDERLAEGDDDEQPVPLAEVLGADVPAFGGSGPHRGGHVEHDRRRPPPRSGLAPYHTAGGHGGEAAEGQDGEPAHGGPLGHVVPSY